MGIPEKKPVMRFVATLELSNIYPNYMPVTHTHTNVLIVMIFSMLM